MVTCRACSSTNVAQAPIKVAPFLVDRMMLSSDAAQACECLECGLLWLHIHPTETQLARYYQDYWQEPYIRHREAHEPGLRNRHPHLLAPRDYTKATEAFIRPHLTHGRILDFGGGTGIEAPFRGVLPVDVYDLAKKDPAEGCASVTILEPVYQLVVLAHVLEHAVAPRDLLAEAAGSCNEEGIVYIEVPNEAASYGKRPRLREVLTVRQSWHEHLQYFDTDSLSALIGAAGLNLVAIGEDEWQGGGLLRAIARPHA